MQLGSLLGLADKVSPPVAFLTGLGLQVFLTFSLPPRVSCLPALVFCFIYALRKSSSPGAASAIQHVNSGRFHAQVPEKSDDSSVDSRKEGLVVFIIGVTCRKSVISSDF